jgi:hypothetical protein
MPWPGPCADGSILHHRELTAGLSSHVIARWETNEPIWYREEAAHSGASE